MSFTVDYRATLAAPVAQAWRALTEPSQLTRWFAAEVEVGQAVGAPFRFWGKHTLHAPGAAAATQRLTRWEPEQALAFSWPMGNVPTMVDIALAADGEQTKIAVKHTVEGDLGCRRQRELIDDHWRLAFGNLAAQLTGGAGIALPDYTDPHPQVRHALTVDASPAVVFRTLIEPALVNQWFGTNSAEVEPRAGGRYAVNWRYQVEGRDVLGGPTRILQFEPGRRLVLDWPDWRGDDTVTGQSIAFTLQPDGERTRLGFIHAGFSRTSDIGDFPFGWAWFLGELKKVAQAQGVA